LTAGVGAAQGQDWPSLLAQQTGWDIINAGVSGDTSAQGLQRLPDLLSEHQPQLVIVGLGGNDFLRRQPSSATVDNLTQIIQTIQAHGAQVAIVAIPQPNLLAAAGATPSDHALYAELGEHFKVPVLEELWGPILGNANLRADTVHANAQGYAQFTDALYARLQSAGFIAP